MTSSSTYDYNREVIDNFRAKGGNLENRPLLLLTTRGARSGQTRVNPLAYSRDRDRYVVLASKGGAPTNPDWYHNLVANPDVTVEVGPQRVRARARVTEGAERDRLFKAHASRMPNFNEYQHKTSRPIPVIVLEPVTD
jgi:deazaflavin-dependent oxidoreductase (nitroreductase family)